MPIHKTAIIDKSSEIDSSSEIGPGVIIEEDVRVHASVRVMANAYICKGTEIGEGTAIYPGAIVGNDPQDYAYNKGAKTYTKIGKNNIIREYVTIHRGTKEGSTTIIGDNNFLMGQVHVGHNCIIDNNVVIANGAILAGYVEVEKNAFISGNVVFHQFCRVGEYAMIGGFTGINKDVPPYMVAQGPSMIRGINFVGLRRAKFSREAISELKKAYNLLYHSGLSREESLGKIEGSLKGEEVQHLISFVRDSKRGICRTRFTKGDYFEE